MNFFETSIDAKNISGSLTLDALRDELNSALSQSMTWCMPDDKQRTVSNAMRSSHFCYMAGKCLTKLAPGLGRLRHISFNDKDIKRESGEWLLDALVAECDVDAFGAEGVVTKIHVAMECESSTAMKDFVIDFSKLLHVKSEAKIYLQGLNQRHEPSARAFMAERLKMASRYIKQIDPVSDWYFGFWPSPLALKIDADDRSLWANIGDEKNSHLMGVKLYKFNGKEFADQG
ncbi:hypothetical protein [Acidovorax sp. CCYZU-2555]|uniref:hypothetical protein n=1 Tax=Acidovorax sp. CCYZU-2555 TaxID=2835042 RepID=UPI001BCD980F|nr:hypothetical protein [Acidovorax sp. CCYZU-2555]MBS7779929.1 hypothetical protein [Acidovorax sp. CCYZU-2555]